jgi:acyl-CoA thioesterase-1
MKRFGPRVIAAYPLTALLSVAACGSSRITSPSATPTVDRLAVVLGDSLAVSPSRDRAFPSELQARIDRDSLRWTVRNESANGWTTADGVRRLDDALEGEVGVLVVALGANDGLHGVAIATIEQNLSTIIERAQSRGVRVLLCGMETPPLNGFEYSLAFHRMFLRLADEYDVPLVPFLLAGVALVPDFNGPDLIHPNAAGAQRIADTVWPYLQPLLRDPTAPIERVAAALAASSPMP